MFCLSKSFLLESLHIFYLLIYFNIENLEVALKIWKTASANIH